MKKQVLLIFSLLVGVFSSALVAQENLGVAFFSTGELALAKDYFQKALSSNPAEANYYLGEIAYQEGNLSEAKSYYEKGLAADSEYALNTVGLGKLLLSSDQKAAESLFSDAGKKDKKNVAVQVAIADAYYANGMKDKAVSKLVDARKVDKKSPLIYIMEGDMMMQEENNPGKASGLYAQAINFDPNNVVAYIKTAKIYELINSATSIDNLNQVLTLRPDYVVAYKYLGNIYYRSGQYNKAIENFKIFFNKGVYSMNDIRNYAAALFFTEQYDEAVKLIQEGLAEDPNNFVFNRLAMYSALETKDYANGVKIGDKLFSLDKEDSEYIARDYMTYGKLLSENGQSEKAIEQYNAAVALDPSQVEVYKDIAQDLGGDAKTEKEYVDAARFYQKYLELANEDQIVALDFYNMGRYYYFAANNAIRDTENPDAQNNAKAYLADADKAFEVVSERVGDSHLGYYWRARANALLDHLEYQQTEKSPGYAKPFYEQTIDIITSKGEGNNVRELSEAYDYLLSYYYLSFADTNSADSKAKTLEYSEKLLEIDPSNSKAQQLIEALK